MLKKIEITNFKNFKEKFSFELDKTKNFEFNKECVKDGIINTGLVYGHNGCGKSNLGLAIFDIVGHLTDKQLVPNKYNNYLNANSNEKLARFKFEFKFGEDIVVYEYTKKNYETLVDEKIKINNKIYAEISRNDSGKFTTIAKGAENLDKNLQDSNISILKYLYLNSILKESPENICFKKFMKFINGMLLYKNLDDKFYIGCKQGNNSIEDYIILNNYVKDFQDYLNNLGIECSLKGKEIDGANKIFFIFKNQEVSFFNIASSGTKSLAIFYAWLKTIENNNCSFLFIDEYDAFYHHTLAQEIIKSLKKLSSTQVILTTHNTSNISNEILRPDCYFIMDNKKITSLKDRTIKELREAHNIEKMYRAGSFE